MRDSPSGGGQSLFDASGRLVLDVSSIDGDKAAAEHVAQLQVRQLVS